MEIERYNQKLTAEMMVLLFTADPSQSTVLSYLAESEILVGFEQEQCIAIAVITRVENVVELKNIAVSQTHQGKGFAKQLIVEAKDLATRIGAVRMEVGTGNSSLNQLALYQKCGFRMFLIVPGFFDSYPEPIYENGIRCSDMVRLYVEL